jgi:hypothetical protein
MTSESPFGADRFMLIECSPALSDKRELETIIMSSLRSLFGVLDTSTATVIEIKGNKAIIQCDSSCLASVRAALTWSTPPPYLQEQHKSFHFHVLMIGSEMDGGPEMLVAKLNDKL